MLSSEKKTETILARVTPAQKAQVDITALRLRITNSQLIREAIQITMPYALNYTMWHDALISAIQSQRTDDR